ncbi:hypothetical protein BDW59DRAFT_84814 [Aspergillus cavernicola]|uniref:BTB domain-containing protein n=1 Tax=Aspergillus cavernicola TaxID=176166 RepID=A0ABR4IAA1_9EURO
MDSTPQVHVSGMEDAPSNTQTPVDTEMTPVPNAGNESPEQTQDISLPDAQPTEAESQPAEAPQPAKLIHFLDFLTSPIVELIVGSDEKKTTMTAHQSLLLESPLLSEKAKAFADSPRRIELPDDDVEAFGYFLQYQYTRDYSTSPSQTQGPEGESDDGGEQLLKHARVYTLAGKLGIPALKSLAHSKIHSINSTSRGELAYARYVYDHTSADELTIRKPVYSFWGSRSHILRHEAGEDFKQLCLDVPQFCFDVLSVALDHREKRTQDRAEAESGVKSSGRKRLRSGL